MQHLVRRDVVQHEADSLGGVQPGWHRNQLTLRQADELRVRAVDRHRGNYLAWFDSRDTGAEPIHHANQIPPRREGHRGRLGMNALARHDVGQGDACGQHSHPHFTILRLGALFFNHPKCIGPAVMSDDDARVSHGVTRQGKLTPKRQRSAPPLLAPCAGALIERLRASTGRTTIGARAQLERGRVTERRGACSLRRPRDAGCQHARPPEALWPRPEGRYPATGPPFDTDSALIGRTPERYNHGPSGRPERWRMGSRRAHREPKDVESIPGASTRSCRSSRPRSEALRCSSDSGTPCFRRSP